MTEAESTAQTSNSLMLTHISNIETAPTSLCELDSYPFIDLLLQAAYLGRTEVVALGLAKALKLSSPDPEGAVASHGQFAHREDLGDLCIIGAFVDALKFCVSRSFTVLQSMQFLLLYSDVYVSIVSLQETTRDEPDPNRCDTRENPLADILFQFTRKLHKLCTRHTIQAEVKKVVTEEVMEERIDQAALAEMEKKKVKKGADWQPPKMMVKVQVEKEIRERKVVTVDPFFRMDDLPTILGFFDSTLFTHWRLFRYMAVSDRQVQSVDRTLAIEDLPAELPPLTLAVTSEDYALHQEQRGVIDEMETAFHEAYQEFVEERSALLAEYEAESKRAQRDDKQRRDNDKTAAMTPEEYERTMKVLDTALVAQMTKKGDQAGLGKRLERIEAAIGRPEQPAAQASGSKPAAGAPKK